MDSVNGTYVNPRRVIRGGVLVAFAGERMSMAEAERRGLLDKAPESEVKAGEAAQAADPADMTRAQLLELAAARGVEVPARARKAEIAELIGASAR